MSEKRKIWRDGKTICFVAVIMAVFCSSVVFAAVAAERSGMYWMGFSRGVKPPNADSNHGFMMVDVSDTEYGGAQLSEVPEEDTEVVSLAIGPTPSIPTLTTEELKLYGILTKGEGFLSSEDKYELNKDIHWKEVVLEKGDTLESLAAEYGLSAANIRTANDLKAGDKPRYAEVIYIPDDKEYIEETLSYVRKLKKAEEDFKKQGKPVELKKHVIKPGESLWSIASQYDVEYDTVVGSNSVDNVNRLRVGRELRIPNQDGIYIKVKKDDTVASLAEKYGSYKEAIYIANMLPEKAQLEVGSELFLPGAKMVVAEAAPRRSNKAGAKVAAVSDAVSSKISPAALGVRLRWPVIGQISSQYGWRRSPFGTRRVFHAGLDIRAPKGRAINAAADGKVVYAGWMSGYGYTIVISHTSSVSTLYGHCSSLVAKKGEAVKSGQLIARVGSTGRSTGNHLHFEVRINGATQNPLKYLK